MEIDMDIFWRDRMNKRNTAASAHVANSGVRGHSAGPIFPLTIVLQDRPDGHHEAQLRNPQGEILFTAYYSEGESLKPAYRSCEVFGRRYNELRKKHGDRSDWYE